MKTFNETKNNITDDQIYLLQELLLQNTKSNKIKSSIYKLNKDNIKDISDGFILSFLQFDDNKISYTAFNCYKSEIKRIRNHFVKHIDK